MTASPATRKKLTFYRTPKNPNWMHVKIDCGVKQITRAYRSRRGCGIPRICWRFILLTYVLLILGIVYSIYIR